MDVATKNSDEMLQVRGAAAEVENLTRSAAGRVKGDYQDLKRHTQEMANNSSVARQHETVTNKVFCPLQVAHCNEPHRIAMSYDTIHAYLRDAGCVLSIVLIGLLTLAFSSG